jgi:hypothetical protein
MRAAETAQAIIAQTIDLDKATVENLATKTLGVLQEQGVYAATLFTFTRPDKEKKIAETMRQQLIGLARKGILDKTLPPVTADTAKETLAFVTTQIANDLDTLLLVKQVWEQTLIYVRYGAKARE